MSGSCGKISPIDAAYTAQLTAHVVRTDSGLKRMLKDKQAQHKWDDADEADFIKALEGELFKVSDFQEKKVGHDAMVTLKKPSALDGSQQQPCSASAKHRPGAVPQADRLPFILRWPSSLSKSQNTSRP